LNESFGCHLAFVENIVSLQEHIDAILKGLSPDYEFVIERRS